MENNTATVEKPKKRIVPKGRVKMIVRREFVGTKSLTEAFIPIICDDIHKQMEQARTIDSEILSQ